MIFLAFSEQFKRECVEGSGISPALFNCTVEFVPDRGHWEPNLALGHNVPRFWQTQRPHNFKEIAFFKNEDGSYWQGKAENPRIDYKKGKTIKYETILGSGSRAFLPAVDLGTWWRVATRHKLSGFLPSWVQKSLEAGLDELSMSSNIQFKLTATEFEDCARALKQSGSPFPIETSSFWQWVELLVPQLSLVITEGGKKAESLLTQGYVAIALYGVNGGYRANRKIGGELIPLEKPDLIEDLKRFCVPGRSIILAFDQDSKPDTREKVAQALAKFGGLLTTAGCEVSMAEWVAQGKGIDDLLVTCGAAAVEEAIAGAIPYTEWAIQRRLGQRVKRKPDILIDNREFSEITSSLPRQGTVVFHGAKGSGKSTAITDIVNGTQWLSITSLQSLARDQAEGWGGAFINEGDIFDGQFLKDGLPVNGGAVCIPSLFKVRSARPKVLILDELTSSLRFILLSKLANRGGIRPVLLDELERRIKEAELVLVADADLTEEALRWVETVRQERAFLVRSTRKPLQWQSNFLPSKSEAIARFVKTVKELPEGKIAYFNSDSKRLVNSLNALLKREGIPTLCITQETSGGEVESAFLSSKGGELPSLAAIGVRVILSSPSVTQGFSIQNNTHLIDSVWGIYLGGSITAQEIAQSLDRVRSDATRYLWVSKKGSGYSKISKATSPRELLREFKTGSTAAIRLVKEALKTEAALKAEALDWENKHFKLIAALESDRNSGMSQLQSTVKALLRHEGKTVKNIPSEVSRAEIQLIIQQLDLLREQEKELRQIAIFHAPPLSDNQVSQLEQESMVRKLSLDELQALERFYIERFYRLKEVTLDDIQFDNQGKMQRLIRNLETVLFPQVATEKTANTINQTPSTPQDWNKAALQRWLLAQTGAIELLENIWNGKITELTPDLIEAVAPKIQSYPKEFKIAFGFSNVDKVAPMQAIATLLDWCGIARQSRRARVDGKIIRRYLIDKAHLEKLKAIVQRRSQADPSPQEIDQNKGGGSSQTLQFPDLVDSVIPLDLARTFREMWAVASEEEQREILEAIFLLQNGNSA